MYEVLVCEGIKGVSSNYPPTGGTSNRSAATLQAQFRSFVVGHGREPLFDDALLSVGDCGDWLEVPGREADEPSVLNQQKHNQTI